MTQQIDGLPAFARNEDECFMREALAEARLAADESEVPIGAVVVLDGEVISRAHNRRESDADPSAHAEFSALCDAARRLGRWRLTGCTVYVTLEPCLMCAGLMLNARVSRCVFGSLDPKGGATGSLYRVNADDRLNHAFEVTGGVLADECSELLRSFFSRLRGKPRGSRFCGGDASSRPSEVDEICCGSRRLDPEGDCDGGRGEALSALRPAGSDSEQAGCSAVAPAIPAPRPRVLLAVDSFKGSASSEQVERWLKEGVESEDPHAEVVCLPVADGGEGTLDAIRAARGGEVRSVTVQDPFGYSHQAKYLLIMAKSEDSTARSVSVSDGAGEAVRAAGNASRDGSIAVIEMAEAAGIGLSPCTHSAALAASTYGVGELLLDAVARGARTVYVGLGGSATVDGGSGFLRALGAKLRDSVGNEVRLGLRGLRDASSIDLAPACEALAGVELVALSDVRNPLVGPRGAVHVFGPQKGLAAGAAGVEPEASLDACDSWMRAYGIRLTDARDALDGTALQVAVPGARPKSLLGVPGAGAAGGLAAALLALGARLESGIDAVLDLSGFDALAQEAALVVTGEGNLDAQSAAGKAPVGIARRAKAVNPWARVVAVCGGRSEDLGAVYEQGVDLVLPIAREPMSLDKALVPEQTRRNLACAGETIARLLDWRVAP